MQLCTTYEEAEPAFVSDKADGVVDFGVNANRLAAVHKSGDRRLFRAGWR